MTYFHFTYLFTKIQIKSNKQYLLSKLAKKNKPI